MKVFCRLRWRFKIKKCPEWDSNPHFAVFEAALSAVGVPGHRIFGGR